MITSRQSLIDSLSIYETKFTEEQTFIKTFLDLLQHPDCFSRTHLPGHITGSSWIIDQSKEFTLLTHHAKLNKWLQPGGHADGDENIVNVALREAEEETGLKNLSLLVGGIFDIDIHTIPARKDFAEHLHYDVRFIFQASRENTLIITEESHDLAWTSIKEIDVVTYQNQSMMRMAQKTKLL